MGDAGNIGETGLNQFGNFVGGEFVVNANPNLTRAEYDDWGPYDASQLAGMFIGEEDDSGAVKAVDFPLVIDAVPVLHEGQTLIQRRAGTPHSFVRACQLVARFTCRVRNPWRRAPGPRC